MTERQSPLPELSLAELFVSARALGTATKLSTMTLHFGLQGSEAAHGTLTISRNPNATRWLTTVGVVQGDRYHARIAQGQTAGEALDKIERYCHWWLGL